MRRGRKPCRCLPQAVAILVALLARPAAAATYQGHVVEIESGRPIPGAFVTLGDHVVTSDDAGAFRVEGHGDAIQARATGHGRASVPLPSTAQPAEDATGLAIALPRLSAKALYLSFYGVGNRALREQALALVDETELNALVIDVKSDIGRIPYPSAVPMARAAGAQGPITVPDIVGLLQSLHRRGVYVIARIVVFKDLPLASARPDLAVHTRDGAVWHDREHLAWTDPFRDEVREYNLDVAVEAARNGFDEIQFDYVRFPDATGLVYARTSTMASRIAAIDELLVGARQRLAPFNVFLSADVFGYVCWNFDDTMIGQRIEDMAPLLDYLSPMLYPSSFQFGIPGYRYPVAHPYEIVRESLERARQRTGLPPERFRPWLQAFRDYAFDRRPFEGTAIAAEISAAEDARAGGWMLWNPRNSYSRAGLKE